jgi:hypothetical protein
MSTFVDGNKFNTQRNELSALTDGFSAASTTEMEKVEGGVSVLELPLIAVLIAKLFTK